MSIRYTDAEISALIAEPKVLPDDLFTLLSLKPRLGHRGGELDVVGANGTKFRIIARQSQANPLDFSVILGVIGAKRREVFRLRRYNGKSHEHTNKIEGQTFHDFHIHTATARYQRSGWQEDAFAEPTNLYSDLHSAFRCLIGGCAISTAPNNAPGLFDQQDQP